MTITIERQRVGRSRVSIRGISIMARAIQGTKTGEDLLAGRGLTDVQCAKETLQERVNEMFRQTVEIVDRPNRCPRP